MGSPPSPFLPNLGEVHKPEGDEKEAYNVLMIPKSFKYHIQGLNTKHLRLRTHVVTIHSWSQARPFSALLIPIFMAYSRHKMTEAKNDIQILLFRVFPNSPNLTLIPAVAQELTDERKSNYKDDHLPWAIMVENLCKTDAKTLLFYQVWLSKKISFVAHPSDMFVTNWVGNYHFYANEDQEKEVISTIQSTLTDKTSTIGKEVDKLPLFLASTTINSTSTRAYKIGRSDPKTHWALYIYQLPPPRQH